METENFGMVGGWEYTRNIFLIFLNFDVGISGDLVLEFFTCAGSSFNWDFDEYVIIYEDIRNLKIFLTIINK